VTEKKLEGLRFVGNGPQCYRYVFRSITGRRFQIVLPAGRSFVGEFFPFISALECYYTFTTSSVYIIIIYDTREEHG
jgi:hypothetical protein